MDHHALQELIAQVRPDVSTVGCADHGRVGSRPIAGAEMASRRGAKARRRRSSVYPRARRRRADQDPVVRRAHLLNPHFAHREGTRTRTPCAIFTSRLAGFAPVRNVVPISPTRCRAFGGHALQGLTWVTHGGLKRAWTGTTWQAVHRDDVVFNWEYVPTGHLRGHPRLVASSPRSSPRSYHGEAGLHKAQPLWADALCGVRGCRAQATLRQYRGGQGPAGAREP